MLARYQNVEINNYKRLEQRLEENINQLLSTTDNVNNLIDILNKKFLEYNLVLYTNVLSEISDAINLKVNLLSNVSSKLHHDNNILNDNILLSMNTIENVNVVLN